MDEQERLESLQELKRQGPGLDSLRRLREALDDSFVEVSITAAECIAMLGPEALTSPGGQELLGKDEVDLEWQLQLAGGKVWAYSIYPNAYSACLNALVKIEADEEVILEYIHNHIGLVNQDDFVDSLRALEGIGTPDAIDLLKRAIAFWQPELDKTHAKQVAPISARHP